jgi:hypothetical protein
VTNGGIRVIIAKNSLIKAAELALASTDSAGAAAKISKKRHRWQKWRGGEGAKRGGGIAAAA